MIRTFLIDMGNVLVHFSHEQMCAQMGALCGQPGPGIHRMLIDSGLLWKFERGQLTESEFHRTFEQTVGCEVEIESLRLACSDIFQLNTPMVPLLEALKTRGHRLVLLSNTCVSHFQFVKDRFDVLKPFDDFVVSYEVGAIKPEAAIYEAALERIECEPAECFYTDDIAEYVQRGRSYGLQAEVFSDAETFAGHLAERGIELPR